MTKKRRRCVHLNVMVTPEEQALIAERMAEAGITNMGGLYAKNGHALSQSMLTSPTSGSWWLSSGGAPTTSIKWRSMPIPTASNLSEITALQKDYADLWGPLSDLIKKLSAVVEM